MFKKSTKAIWLFVFLVCSSFLIEWVVISAFSTNVALGQEPIDPPSSLSLKTPKPTSVSSVPEEFKDLVWNKWDTENFVVLSISEQQGIYLKDNIENTKNSLLKSWGMKDFDFSTKCKLVCVSDKEMLDKLFKKQDFHMEVRKNPDGKIEASVIWFYLDDTNAMGKLNSSVLSVCLSEFSQKVKSVPEFCKIGMCELSKNTNQVKQVLLQVGDTKASDLINGSDLSEAASAALCLMMRKEYGQNNFLNYLLSGGDLKLLGFNDLNQLDNTFDRYKDNLKKDLNNNLVPDNYLKIESPN